MSPHPTPSVPRHEATPTLASNELAATVAEGHRGSRARRGALLAVAAGLLGAVLTGAPSTAQIPETFTNLQLLDKDVSRAQIVGIMRDWAGGLGVRCNHCHVGPDNLQGMDFATDEKATKRTARKMLEMSRTLNRDLLNDLPVVAEGERHQVVSCYTCHRGQPTPPRNLRVELGTTYQAQGIDATIERLGQLMDAHGNAGRYDFTPRNLASLGQQLVELGQTDDAIAWLTAMTEIVPGNPDLLAALGLTKVQSGDVEGGREALEEALAIHPEHPMASRAKAQLDSANP